MRTAHTANSSTFNAFLEAAMGEYLLNMMQDDSVLEIQVNSDGKIWLDKVGKPVEWSEHIFPATQARNLINLIAHSVGLEATKETPSIYAEMPEFNARFQAEIPPIVSAPCFVIRKHQSVLFPLDHYVERGYLSQSFHKAITDAILDNQSILICGGTSSGKTTFANAILLEMAKWVKNDRVIIIEDTAELQCKCPNSEKLRAKIGVMDMHDLIRDTLRLTPKRIIVGEVRGKEASAMIEAWMVGHSGIATIHANNCRDALTRLETMLARAGITTGYERLICTAIKKLLFIGRTTEGWKVKELYDLRLDNGNYLLENV